MNVHSLATSVEFIGLSGLDFKLDKTEKRQFSQFYLLSLSYLDPSPSSTHNGWVPHLCAHEKEYLDFHVVDNSAFIAKQRNEDCLGVTEAC